MVEQESITVRVWENRECTQHIADLEIPYETRFNVKQFFREVNELLITLGHIERKEEEPSLNLEYSRVSVIEPSELVKPISPEDLAKKVILIEGQPRRIIISSRHK